MQCSRQCCCVSTAGIMVSAVVFAVASFFIIRSASGSMFHAECEVNWQVPIPCEQVRDGLVTMMNTWTGDTNCGVVNPPQCPSLPCGQKCLYEYKSDQSTDSKIFGVHLTPVKRYSDSFNFEFTPLDGTTRCAVKGYSTSDLWYAVLDFGTNFCNLRNLMDGAFDTGAWPHPKNVSKLDEWEGFSEMTTDSKCTQYSSRDCTRY